MNGRNPAEVLATLWHGGQWSGLYALQCGARDPDTLERAAREFRDCADKVALTSDKYRLEIAAQWCENAVCDPNQQ